MPPVSAKLVSWNFQMSTGSRENLELLKAALAMAAVDGKVCAREKSLLKALAAKAGVGGVSLQAMIDRAMTEPADRAKLFQGVISQPEKAMQLLVAAASIDGAITEDERSLLVDISFVLGVSSDRFDDVFRDGLAAAKRVTKRRKN
jgi:uncharacterized membrane protein YebE (DUF533 family)